MGLAIYITLSIVILELWVWLGGAGMSNELNPRTSFVGFIFALIIWPMLSPFIMPFIVLYYVWLVLFHRDELFVK